MLIRNFRSVQVILFFSLIALVFTNLHAKEAKNQTENKEVGFSAIILSYQSISDRAAPTKSTSPRIFEKQILELKQRGFTIWRLSDLMLGIQKRAKLPPKLAAITFDGGYKSVLTNAYPILERHKIPFTIFVSRDFAKYDNPLYLNMEDLKKLSSSNLVEIGNNTLSLSSLATKSSDETYQQWQKRLVDAVVENAEWIKQEFKPTRLLAYPKGEVSPELEKLAKKLHYYAFTQTSGAASLYTPLVKIPRFDMTGIGKDMYGFKNKILSVPFPVKNMNYRDDNILSQNPRPMLELELYMGEYRIESLHCFDRHGYKIPSSFELIKAKNQEDSVYKIRMRPEQESSESKIFYNCIMPHKTKNNWFWFSKMFFAG